MIARLRRPASLLACLVCIVLAGCVTQPPPAMPTPEGRIDILGPAPGFSVDPLESHWQLTGDRESAVRGLEVVDLEGVPALRATSGERAFAIARPMDALLMVSRYLSWSWYLPEQISGPGLQPVHLVIGFQGGNPSGRSWTDGGLPSRDRMLVIGWGEADSDTGTLHAGAPPRYIARGGRVNVANWWVETVDLADLYARAWPNDAISRARVSFVGVAAMGERPPSTTYLAGLMLSR